MHKLLPLIFLLTVQAAAAERFVNLYSEWNYHGSFIPSQIQIGTNEVVTVTAMSGTGSYKLQTTMRTPYNGNYVYGVAGLGWQMAGPVHLYLFSDTGTSYVTLRIWSPDTNTPPAQITSAPLPAGIGARVGLQSSVDLVNWVDTPEGDLPKEPTNRFFRVKLILAK